jgi:AcrR family transcriptional regulator
MSPRSSEQLDELREQRKADILEAALTLFARQGFHNTSIEQIRKKAGVSKGLIYNYFEKKEDLVTAILMREVDEGDDLLAHMMALPTAQEKVRWMLGYAFDSMVQSPEHQKLVAALSLQLDLPEFAHLKEMIMGRVVGVFPLAEQLMRELGFAHPATEGRAFTALLDGIGLQYLMLGGEVIDLDEMKRYLLRRYCAESSAEECDDHAPEPQDSHPEADTNHQTDS